MNNLTSRGILKSQIGPTTTSPTPNGSLYNNGPWSDNLKTTTITPGMLNRDKTQKAIKNRPKMTKNLPEIRANETASVPKPEMSLGKNVKRQALMNVLKK